MPGINYLGVFEVCPVQALATAIAEALVFALHSDLAAWANRERRAPWDVKKGHYLRNPERSVSKQGIRYAGHRKYGGWQYIVRRLEQEMRILLDSSGEGDVKTGVYCQINNEGAGVRLLRPK